MPNDNPVSHVYVGRLKACGCAVDACSDIDDEVCVNAVKEMVDRGYAVERMTCEDYRKNVRLECKCPRPNAPAK